MKIVQFCRVLSIAAVMAMVMTMAGCATRSTGQPSDIDPLESSNRAIYNFNDTIDRAILTPVAEAYRFITPQPVRTCINNIFLNLGDVWSGLNSFMQGRQEDALNTTAGLGGCLDLASTTGAKRIPNDFGVTLGVWGIGSGPYIVLPIIGSSSVRDGVGRGVDLYVGQVEFGGLIQNVNLRNSTYGLQVVERREALLDVTETVDRTALDPYSFIRDAYLQRRKAQVRGENAAAEKLPEYEDFEDAQADKAALGLTPKK